MSTLPSYEQSLQILRERGIIGGKESPPQPSMMPQPEDAEPSGLRFFRTGFEADADLSGISIARTFFGKSEIANVSFRKSDLAESNLRWNDFIDVDFRETCLAQADLRASEFLRVRFDNADLSRADLRYSNYEDCTFERANLNGAKLAEDQKEELRLDEDQIRQISWQPGHGAEPSGG